jgi:hypothetical protein
LLANYPIVHYELCDIRLGKISKWGIINMNTMWVKQVKQMNIASEMNKL